MSDRYGETSLSFDRIADEYDATRGGERRGEQFAPGIAALLDTSRPVLEVGVGTGVIVRALRQLGFEVFGVDISHQMLARAYARVGSRVAQGDAKQLPLAAACLDQVISVWVLHVVGDPVAAMRDVARVLRPGGKYLVVDGKPPHEEKDAVGEAFRELDAALGITEPRFGRARIYEKMAPDAGLEVADIVPLGPFPFMASIAEAADNIERRQHSWMWNIPDDVWERAAPPIIAKLRAIPGYEIPVKRHDYQEVLVLRKP